MAKTNKNRLRNLRQYKELTDEEFDNVWAEYEVQPDTDFDSKVEKIMEDLAQNYDIRDQYANDTLSLRELASLYVSLEMLTNVERQMMADGSYNQVGNISRIRNDYIKNASQIQKDLNITRQARQADDGETLDTFLPSIKKKSINFLSQRLAYIYCPECRMLCGNCWWTDWNVSNIMKVTCPREECGNTFEVTSQYLAEHKNKNIDGVLNV